jgi:hypothetical protein
MGREIVDLEQRAHAAPAGCQQRSR